MSDTDPTEWEYRCLRPPREETKKEVSDPTADLNELGAVGWELVDTLDYTGGGTKFLVFKRPSSASASVESPLEGDLVDE
ncbi:hypothetical protein [Candidatus Halobonum tyrrellensis]|uniref:hypothetical protein n=1 Tax=Candidatus Halobonum tyrrellensis TaxID=1431545 RepID=UPI0006777FBB|nr:hypothetical protein [Candidatus Halobonum tyrrellensis]